MDFILIYKEREREVSLIVIKYINVTVYYIQYDRDERLENFFLKSNVAIPRVLFFKIAIFVSYFFSREAETFMIEKERDHRLYLSGATSLS